MADDRLAYGGTRGYQQWQAEQRSFQRCERAGIEARCYDKEVATTQNRVTVSAKRRTSNLYRIADIEATREARQRLAIAAANHSQGAAAPIVPVFGKAFEQQIEALVPYCITAAIGEPRKG